MDKTIEKLYAACQTEDETVVLNRLVARISKQKTFNRWLADMRERMESAIPHSDPVWDMAAKSGITPEMVKLCWMEFKIRHDTDPKRGIDWRRTFRNCVRSNWYRLWYADADGKIQLTSQGRILEKQHE